MINLMLVDDHDLVRIGFTRLLSDVKGIAVVGEARNGEDAVKMAKALKPDVILMDVKMPGIGGLEATRKILRILPDTKIIAVTVYGDEPYPSRFLQAGACGYITKGSSLEEMVKAIRTVFNGQRYLCPEVAQLLALKHFNDENASPFETLSARELQVMMMITAGQKVQDISDSLCLSAKTVNSYRYRLFEKLNVNSDVELTHLAIRHGLIDTEGADADSSEQTTDD